MKSLHGLASALFLVMSTVQAYADSISTADPVIKVGGASRTSAPIPFENVLSPTAITVRGFSIFSESGTSPGTSPCVLMEAGTSITSPSCFLENDITHKDVGVTIKQLIFDTSGISPRTVTCGKLHGSPFDKCRVKSLPGTSGAEVTFFDGSIPFHGDFTLDFEAFPVKFSFAGTATPSPGVVEPSSLLMFLGGIGALLTRRRLWSR
jgi:hypothetical protein